MREIKGTLSAIESGILIKARVNDVSELQTKKSDLESTITDLESQKAMAAAPIDQYKSALSEIEGNISKLDSALTELYQGNLQAAIEFANAQTTISLGEMQIASAESGLDSAQKQLEAGEEQIKSGQEQLDAGADQIKEGYDQINDNAEQLADALEQILDGEEQIEEAREDAYDQADMNGILTVDTVEQLLAAQNFSMPAGYVTEDGISYLIRVGDKPDTVEELKAMPILNVDMDGVDVITLLQQGGNAGHCADILFQAGDLILGCAGHELHDKTARALHRQIRVDQNAQRADRWCLLTDGKIVGDILGNLTGNQRHLADIGFPHTKVADHIQCAILTHGSADVQVAVRARGQLHDGVFDIAFYIARAVGNGQNTARRAAALDLYGDRIRIRFEHLAHHGNTGQQAAQGCGGNGAGFVQLLHSAHNGGGINAIEQDAAVFRNAG